MASDLIDSTNTHTLFLTAIFQINLEQQPVVPLKKNFLGCKKVKLLWLDALPVQTSRCR